MKKRLIVFLEFLLTGIFLGIIEDIILIRFLTNEPITPLVLLIIFFVTLPFAFIGEYFVDMIDFIEIFNLKRKFRKVEVFLEFLIFGVLLGIVEDLTAFYFAIGNPFTFRVVLAAAIVAVPFAFFGEVLVDRIDLLKTFKNKKVTWKK